MRDSTIWAVVPAAGAGRRFGAALPKQYLDLGGRSVIERSLSVLVDHQRIAGVWVALDPGDRLWSANRFADHPRVYRVAGGVERCHSVLNALDGLAGVAAPGDWVLVHDAARPCLRPEDLDRLITELGSDPVGGLLGVPVRDTMKRADGVGRVSATVDRANLWHAYTPQMFRLGVLAAALRDAVGCGDLVTDEASAMERLGHRPRLVEGHGDNIKITRAEDLPLARFFLEQQGRLG
ncbi:MAG: 2-C-methyl-D-erythritol 4-phosphate cytidylyltransferase [Bdellovibrio bacteriovorus]